jgi:hypothetical protein
MDAICEDEEADNCQRAEWKGLRLWMRREAGGGSSFLLLIVLARATTLSAVYRLPADESSDRCEW